MTDPLVPSRRARMPDRDVLRLAATTVAASLLAWWPAFTLGVYKTIFFEQLFALWAAATSAFLVAVLMLGRRAWAQPAIYVLFWVGVVVTLIGLPAMVSLVVLVVIPGAESVRRPGPVAVAIGVIAIVGVLSYIVGTQHPRLLTCEEFTISGNDQPVGCTPSRDVGR
jgi:hypothetical protein